MQSSRAVLLALGLAACLHLLCPAVCQGQGGSVSGPGGAASSPAALAIRFGDARLFHGRQVRFLAFTPDSRHILAAGSLSGMPGDISIWRVEDGRLVRTIEAPNDAIYFMTLPRVGHLGIMVGSDRRLRTFDWRKGILGNRLPRKAVSNYLVALSPDGNVVAVPDGSNLSVEDLHTGKRRFLVRKGSVGTFSDDGVYLAVTSRRDADFGVQLYDVLTGAKIRKFEAPSGKRFLMPAFSRDGRFLAAGCTPTAGYEAAVWRAGTGRMVHKLRGNGGYVSSLVFGGDGNTLIACAGSGKLLRWDLRDGNALEPLKAGEGYLYCLALSPDGRWLAAGGRDGRICLWDTDGFKRMAMSRGHDAPVRSVAASKGARLVATGGGDGLVRLWEGRSGKRLGGFPLGQEGVRSVAVSADGGLVAAAGPGLGVRLWRTDSREMIRLPAPPAQDVMWVGFQRGGRRLIVLGQQGASAQLDVEARKWKALSLDREGVGKPNARGRVVRQVLAPDGRLACSVDGGVVTPWVVATGRELGVFRVPNARTIYNVALGPRGRLAACDVGSRMVLMELDSAQAVATADNSRRRTGMFGDMKFSPDGSLVAAAEYDGTVTVWSVRSLKKVGKLGGVHRGQVSFLGFTPDGRKLLTGGGDGTAALWDLASALAADDAPLEPTWGTGLEESWGKLASDDGAEAGLAYRLLVEAGDTATALIGEKLQPVAPAVTARIAELIEQLGDDRVRIRQEATEALGEIGPQAVPALRRAAGGDGIAEVRIRARQILAVIGDPARRSGVMLRPLRAALVLEEIGTQAAVGVLHRLARGASDAALTRRAREALGRMGRTDRSR